VLTSFERCASALPTPLATKTIAKTGIRNEKLIATLRLLTSAENSIGERLCS
jgi:hypothetical protein